MAKIVIFPGSEDEGELELNKLERLTLGRDMSNDLVIKRRMASRRHAVIERDGDAFTLVDVGSYNGTWVNGRTVQKVRLASGDEIRVANRTIRFVDHDHPGNPLESAETLPTIPTLPPDDMLDETMQITPLTGDETPALPRPAAELESRQHRPEEPDESLEVTVDDAELLAEAGAALEHGDSRPRPLEASESELKGVHFGWLIAGLILAAGIVAFGIFASSF